MFTRMTLEKQMNNRRREREREREKEKQNELQKIKQIKLLINNQTHCPLFDQSQYQFEIDKTLIFSNKKIISKLIDHIFSTNPHLQKPITLTNEKIIKESLDISNFNQNTGSVRPKDFHSLYCLRITGLKSEGRPVNYIGSSMETFGKVVKTISHSGYDTIGGFMFNGKDIDENNSLKECGFVENVINDVHFKRDE